MLKCLPLVCCSHSGESCITFMTAMPIWLFPHPINMFVSFTTSNICRAVARDSERPCPHL